MITEAPAKIDQSDTLPSAHILIKYLDKDQSRRLPKTTSLSFTPDGHDKFRDLFADIRQAKSSINVEYYTYL
jgi:cardiolipin synthase